jgi:hypothetical protein
MSIQELQNRKDSLKLEKKDSQIYCDHIIDTSNKTPKETMSIVLEIIKNK